MIFHNRALKGFAKQRGFNVSLTELHALGLESTYKFFDYLFDCLPSPLAEHRRFFENDCRGFGERAFHSGWLWIFMNFFGHRDSVINCLEIGVFKGQTLTLFPIIAEHLNKELSALGLSPFDSSGDDVSVYGAADYYKEVKEYAHYLGISDSINLIKAYSNDPIGIEAIASKDWDLIYIDGSHDYDVVKSDFLHSARALKVNGILVFDDSSLFSQRIPLQKRLPGFPGHPGPSRVVDEICHYPLLHVLTIGHLNIFLKTLG
jgi:hypothetical protein